MTVPDHGAGSVTVEVVVLTPVIVLFAVFVAALVRVESVRAQVSGAARAAAEAAAEAPDASSAVVAAADAAPAAVTGDGVACTPLSVRTGTAAFVPGGAVSVVVTCRVSMAGLVVPGLPGSVTVSSQVSAPIDTYRGAG